jgi:hypothetical protein
MEGMDTPTPEPQQFRFSLRQLLVFVLAIALFSGAMRVIGFNPVLILVCPAIAMACDLLLRPKNGWGNVAIEIMFAGILVALLVLLCVVIGVGETLG